MLAWKGCSMHCMSKPEVEESELKGRWWAALSKTIYQRAETLRKWFSHIDDIDTYVQTSQQNHASWGCSTAVHASPFRSSPASIQWLESGPHFHSTRNVQKRLFLSLTKRESPSSAVDNVCVIFIYFEFSWINDFSHYSQNTPGHRVSATFSWCFIGGCEEHCLMTNRQSFRCRRLFTPSTVHHELQNKLQWRKLVFSPTVVTRFLSCQ